MDLQEVNEYFVQNSLWPAIVFTVLMLVIGTVGNGFVLIIYRKDYNKSVTWIFIYALAAVDICSCLVSMPAELTILFNMMDFPSWGWCKASRYLSYIFHGSSCVILMAIAFHRYDRLCRSNSQWLDAEKAKKFCVGIFIFASVLNIPMLFLYGEYHLDLAIDNHTARIINKDDKLWFRAANSTSSNSLIPEVVKGRLCYIKSEYYKSVFAKICFVLEFLMFIVLLILVVFFYTKVIGKLVSYRKQQERKFKLDAHKEMSGSSECQSDMFLRDAQSDLLSEPIKTPTVAENKMAARVQPAKDLRDGKDNHSHVTNPQKGADDVPTRPAINVQVSDAINLETGGFSVVSSFVESNKLLSRRRQSADILNRPHNSIPCLMVPNMEVNDNSKSALFLHASKIHKKRGQYDSDRRDDRTCRTNEDVITTALETKDDLYLHKKRHLNGYRSQSIQELSFNETDTLNVANKTMILNRRSPKGSHQCVLPICGLSVKNITSYDGLRTSREELSKKPRQETGSLQNVMLTPKNESLEDKTTDSNAAVDDSHHQASVSDGSRCRSEKNSAKKKLVQQQSVTFDTQETDASLANKSPTRRKIFHQDSTTHLFGAQEDDEALPNMRHRTRSLVGPSRKTMGYNRRVSLKPIQAIRTSSMLLIISLAFIFSFLPFWIVVIWRAVDGKHFISYMNSTGFGVMAVCIRSSLISNAVNPVVYGLVNSQFRRRCKKIFCKR